nr:hypothetical protein CFP56_62525 [Quercus suber]
MCRIQHRVLNSWSLDPLETRLPRACYCHSLSVPRSRRWNAETSLGLQDLLTLTSSTMAESKFYAAGTAAGRSK